MKLKTLHARIAATAHPAATEQRALVRRQPRAARARYASERVRCPEASRLSSYTPSLTSSLAPCALSACSGIYQ